MYNYLQGHLKVKYTYANGSDGFFNENESVLNVSAVAFSAAPIQENVDYYEKIKLIHWCILGSV